MFVRNRPLNESHLDKSTCIPYISNSCDSITIRIAISRDSCDFDEYRLGEKIIDMLIKRYGFSIAIDSNGILLLRQDLGVRVYINMRFIDYSLSIEIDILCSLKTISESTICFDIGLSIYELTKNFLDDVC